MATDSTSRGFRQSHLFMTLLVLLWGLILCFIGYQYSREHQQVRALLTSRLQLLNLQMGDDINSGVTPANFYERNTNRFDNFSLVVIDSIGKVVYDSKGDYNGEHHSEIIDALKSATDGAVVREQGDLEYIYTANDCGGYTVSTSASYSLSFFEVLSKFNIFLIIAIAISLLITAVGFLTSRLYNNLKLATEERDREHEIARREEQDKIRLKRQLTNNINHELKTPICSIIGYLEMVLNNDSLDAQTTRNFVAKSYDQAERLRRLMFDLATITRIDEASEMVEREVIDLTALIDGVKEDLMPLLDKQHIALISNVDTQLFIEGNHSLLYSIFRNLLDNAIAYSGARNIWIDLTSQDDKLFYFSVRDNGIGIDAQHIPYIFERFYRVDKGRSRKLGGTGLGLSIVKNAVLFHGGTIEAMCDDMGGLEFRFSLGEKCEAEDKA